MSWSYSREHQKNILCMIMAGGQGSRLQPLTRDRAKPAVHFGGTYRIIDFVLNNFINSGIFKIKVLTQFKSDSQAHFCRLEPECKFGPVCGPRTRPDAYG